MLLNVVHLQVQKKRHITKESDLLYNNSMLLTMIQMTASVGDDFYPLACSPSPFLIRKCNDNGNGDGNKNVIKRNRFNEQNGPPGSSRNSSQDLVGKQ